MALDTIDSAAIAAFGSSLNSVANALKRNDNVEVDCAAFGNQASSAAFEHLMTGWRRGRLQLASALTDLGDRAHTAGNAYVVVEQKVGRSMLGGPTT